MASPDWRRYTFPLISHSAAYMENIGDQFWIFECKPIMVPSISELDPKMKVIKKSRNIPRHSSTVPSRNLYRPCQKLKKFKKNRVDPVVENIQNFLQGKTTDASNNFKAMREVIKSEEFVEIKTKFSKEETRNLYAFHNAAQETLLLFKAKKSQFI